MMAFPPPAQATSSSATGPGGDLFSPSETASLQGFLSDFAAADPLADPSSSLHFRPPPPPPQQFFGSATPKQPPPFQQQPPPSAFGPATDQRTPHMVALEAFKSYAPAAAYSADSAGQPPFEPARHVPMPPPPFSRPPAGAPGSQSTTPLALSRTNSHHRQPSHPNQPPPAQTTPKGAAGPGPFGASPSTSSAPQFGGGPSAIQTANAEREARMRQQTMELSAWMNARGISSAPPTATNAVAPTPQTPSSGALSRSAVGAPAAVPPASTPASTSTTQPRSAPASKPKTAATKAAKGKGKAKQEDGAQAAGQPATGPAKREKALLSNEQKRANHIASEQKRRAAIRQGYDRLCDVVPSLRCALRGEPSPDPSKPSASLPNGSSHRPGAGAGTSASDEDDELGTGGEGNGGEGKKKKRKKRDEVNDGRAGPKSEATVLAKTVDHLRDLDAERLDLTRRLTAAHSLALSKGLRVPPGDPAERRWEMPWSKEMVGDEYDDGESDGEGEDGDPVGGEGGKAGRKGKGRVKREKDGDEDDGASGEEDG